MAITAIPRSVAKTSSMLVLRQQRPNGCVFSPDQSYEHGEKEAEPFDTIADEFFGAVIRTHGEWAPFTNL
jgi:hypothetical protein